MAAAPPEDVPLIASVTETVNNHRIAYIILRPLPQHSL